MTAAVEQPLFDPSELLRPEPVYDGKLQSQFRDYSLDENDPIKERVRQTYKNMHTYQTVDFVREYRGKWLKFDKWKLTIKEALIKLNEFIDESDPDIDVPNIVHGFQTAEAIRKEHPDKPWFQLAGLIHDLGKIMAFAGEPQWAVTGDTFPVGCAWADSIVYRDTSFVNNPDGKDPRYNTKYGMYKPNCGLDDVLMAWGHDEYLYQVLKNHPNCTLPKEALVMIRFHSFYPWHAGGDYKHLCSKDDEEVLRWVLELNKYDLYTKNGLIPDIEKLWPYYEELIDKYIPGVVAW